jgi:hypothetical protein
MARPNKMGLEYYQFDTDIFLDRKVRRLIKSFNSDGFLTYIFVLTEIYRDKGFYILWNNDISFDVSDQLNIPENLINEIINFCCEIKLFNKEMLIHNGILTSKSIQERWSKISKDAKRSICDVKHINPKYELIQEETPKVQEETLKPTEETLEVPVIMPQSIVKETIVKESIEENNNPLPPKKLAIKKVKTFSEEVYNCLNEILNYFPEHLHPDTNAKKDNWLNTIRLLNETDLIPFETIIQIVKSAREDGFWSTVFLALPKLRTNDKNGIKYIVVLNEKFKNNILNDRKNELFDEIINQNRNNGF